MNRMNKAPVWIFGLLSLVAMLSACDPAQSLRVTHSGYRELSCADGRGMRYVVDVQYTDGQRDSDEFKYYHEIMAGFVPGWEDRVEWVQFTVYCQDEKKPLLVTPRLTPEDFVQKDEWNFYYFVDGGVEDR